MIFHGQGIVFIMVKYYLASLLLIFFSLPTYGLTVAQSYCESKNFHCVVTKAGETWENTWSDPEQRLMVQRINRRNKPLEPGVTLAVPNDLENLNALSFSPIPVRLKRQPRRTIWVYLEEQAWGAYDHDGRLLRWGPISSGANFCPDSQRSCRTPTGNFYTRYRQGSGCRNSASPQGECGGPGLPTCIYYSVSRDFSRRYAFVPSNELPGFPSTHGCLHIFPSDMTWLYNNFAYIPQVEGDRGSAVKVR